MSGRRSRSAIAAKAKIDARIAAEHEAMTAQRKDVLEALRVIRDAAKRGDPKALAVVAFCVSPFT